jgi:von Willebrand factor type A domain
MNIKKIAISVLLGLSLTLPNTAVYANTNKPKIQIAILLDSSNSMDGLIDQAKTQLWKIVNALSTVTKDGKTPELEVALYEYGNDNIPSQEGFVRQLTSFTPELDRVSEKLFKIKTLGGQEYTGWVIKSATKQLQWTGKDKDFHVIFIAGNEPFDQGEVDYKQAIKLATNQDILVNTIYCGNSESEERQLWSDGANLGKGNTFNINQDRQIVEIKTPYDQDIEEWNQKLNKTYIPFGRYGLEGQNRQMAQDSNANLVGGATRGAAKASKYYRNVSWDLVDALEDRSVKLEDIADSSLPEEMQGLSLKEKRQYVARKKAAREKIQAKIRELYEKRTDYITKQKQNIDPQAKDTLDYVIIQSLRQQLAKKGFTLR